MQNSFVNMTKYFFRASSAEHVSKLWQPCTSSSIKKPNLAPQPQIVNRLGSALVNFHHHWAARQSRRRRVEEIREIQLKPNLSCNCKSENLSVTFWQTAESSWIFALLLGLGKNFATVSCSNCWLNC